uniref:Uncharacterized protein n=1 Tax=Laurencia australis TaxID=3073067 RepID=A0AA51NEF7_9FLOR|nr:hypothetical protein [Laurencia australis]WMP12058.1 hypothetical protein [Laurencia australis]
MLSLFKVVFKFNYIILVILSYIYKYFLLRLYQVLSIVLKYFI